MCTISACVITISSELLVMASANYAVAMCWIAVESARRKVLALKDKGNLEIGLHQPSIEIHFHDISG
jgi:hypothetical protein